MGGVLALWLTGTPFSISAAVGFISVFGVAVQDGVLLISYFNQLRAAGLPVREAVMRGAELRVRPVVMTSLTAALGLLPAALATSIGSQAQKPLAIVVVGAHALHPVPDPIPDARALLVLPGPRRATPHCDSELILGSHYTDRFLHPSAATGTPSRKATHHHDHGHDGHDATPPAGHERFRRLPVMKLNWKSVLAVLCDRRRRDRGDAQQEDARPGRRRLAADRPSRRPTPRRPPPDKSWTEAPKSKEPWDRTVSLTQEQSRPSACRRSPCTPRPTRRSCRSSASPTTTRPPSPSSASSSTAGWTRSWSTSARSSRRTTRCSSCSAPTWPRPRATTRSPSASGPTTRRSSITRPRWPRTTPSPSKELIEVENDEAQSRLKMKLAKDKLLVYGLTDEEIEAAKNEDGKQKARMTLRSRADGVVVKRDVVPGNYYDSKDDPADHRPARPPLGARRRQRARRRQGRGRPEPQGHLPLLPPRDRRARSITSTRRSIPTRASAKFRATIPNPGGRVKAGAFVKVQVHDPARAPGGPSSPAPPWSRSTAPTTSSSASRARSPRFERRPIIAAKESNDIVVVAEPAEGHRELKPGEEVVTTRQPDPRADVRGQAHGRGRLAGLGSGPREGRSFPPERGHPDGKLIARHATAGWGSSRGPPRRPSASPYAAAGTGPFITHDDPRREPHARAAGSWVWHPPRRGSTCMKYRL